MSTMKTGAATRLFLFFLLVWLLLNGIQAILTELDPDEAYYWVYSQQLDWGYFDHPPMIALLIRLSSQVIPGTLGVRFFPVVLSLGTFYFLWRTLKLEQNLAGTRVFIALVLAMPFLHVYSFIATPDAPLLFFAALYLWLYRRFLQRADWGTTFLLGTTMAALLYSKYHGVLLILLLLAAQWRVLKRPQFYVASIWGFLLFSPHLYWQFAHDFPSFTYHLTGRNDRYVWRYTSTYLYNQLLVFSPFMVYFLGTALARLRSVDAFERGWKLLILGFFFFFLSLTAKGHAEPQWTLIAVLPAILVLEQAVERHLINRRWVLRMSGLSLLFLLLARILIILPQQRVDSDFHKKHRAYIVEAEAAGLPVLYMDTYRAPSKFAFYTGQRPYALTDVYYRKNQYDLWDWAKALHNQKVMIIAQKGITCDFCRPLQMEGEEKGTLVFADSLQVTQNIRIYLEEVPDTLVFGESQPIQIRIDNPYGHTVRAHTGNLPLQLVAILTDELDHIQWYPLDLQWTEIPAAGSTSLEGQLLVPDFAGKGRKVRLAMGFKTGVLAPTYNSAPKSVHLRH